MIPILGLKIAEAFFGDVKALLQSRIVQLGLAAIVVFYLGHHEAANYYEKREELAQIVWQQKIASEHARREIAIDDAQELQRKALTDLTLQKLHLAERLKELENASRALDRHSCLDARSVQLLDAVSGKSAGGR